MYHGFQKNIKQQLFALVILLEMFKCKCKSAFKKIVFKGSCDTADWSNDDTLDFRIYFLNQLFKIVIL